MPPSEPSYTVTLSGESWPIIPPGAGKHLPNSLIDIPCIPRKVELYYLPASEGGARKVGAKVTGVQLEDDDKSPNIAPTSRMFYDRDSRTPQWLFDLLVEHLPKTWSVADLGIDAVC